MKKITGFTMLEMMAVVAVIGILAAMALPSYMFKIVREQIEAAIPLADIAKGPIASAWQLSHTLPSDNIAAALPAADKIVNNFVSSVAVDEGAIHIRFGNRAHKSLQGKILSLRPAVIPDAQIVPITWVCAGAGAPEKMILKGSDKTTVPSEFLPLICRAKSKS